MATMRQAMSGWASACLRVATAGALSYFVFWACAPAAMMPPPLPMAADTQQQVGLAAGIGYPAVVSGENAVQPSVQLWYQRAFSPKLNLWASGFAGTNTLIGAGVGLQYVFFERPRLRVGVELQGGFAYARLGLPVMVGLGNHVWLYTSPSVQYALTGLGKLPLGLAVRHQRSTFFLEGGTDFGMATQNYYGSLGYAFSF